MISVLSALSALFALATDREEDKVSVKLLIATWLALGDYDSIIRHIGMWKPKIKPGDNLYFWKEEEDPAFQFVKAYAQTVQSRSIDSSIPYPPEKARWLNENWGDLQPDLLGLVNAYNDLAAIMAEEYDKPGQRIIGIPGFTFLAGSLWRSFRQSSEKAIVIAPGWNDEGWPNLPPHPGEVWLAQHGFVRGSEHKVQVGRLYTTPDWDGRYAWNVFLEFEHRRPVKKKMWISFEQSFKQFCISNDIFIVMEAYPPGTLTWDDQRWFGSKRIDWYTTLLEHIIPNLGKMSDAEISRITNGRLNAVQIGNLRKVNRIPVYRKDY
jgi:hypothetical protein